ncbi:hypothetical protein [Novosphingobium sp.]|uniref:WYL domain-containing protein n=1 Tax=Novosphingobium sp. TaxID=1874826 RepID=UPI0038BDC1C4
MVDEFAKMVGALAGPLAVVVAVRPQLFRLDSRWWAVALIGVSFAALGVDMMNDLPSKESDDPFGSGVTALVIAAGLIWWGSSRARRATPRSVTPRDAKPVRSSERVPVVPATERDLPQGIVAKAVVRRGATVEERLTNLFDQHRTGAIGLEEYRAGVQEELADCDEAILLHRRSQGDMDADDYQAELEELEDEREECRWRLKWIADQEYKASISREGFPEQGKWARFEYTDADGEVSKRTIAMWQKRGAYIVGFDRSRKAERTFRQDRISDWVCG